MARSREDDWLNLTRARRVAGGASSHAILLGALRGAIGYRVRASRTEFRAEDVERFRAGRAEVLREVPAVPASIDR